MLDQHVENGMEVRVVVERRGYTGHEGVILNYKESSFGRVWAEVELVSKEGSPVVTFRASDLEPVEAG